MKLVVLKIAGQVTTKIHKQRTITTTKCNLYELKKEKFSLHGLNCVWGCAEKSQEGTLDVSVQQF